MGLGHVGNFDHENACVDIGCLGRDSVCSLMDQFEKMSDSQTSCTRLA